MLVRVDLAAEQVSIEPLPTDLKTRGGRYLTSKVVNEEVPPSCHPLGPENRLVVANGPLAGTSLSSTGRVSIGGKSPLTGGIKEANSGGMLGVYLASLDMRAIVFSGQCAARTWRVLHVSKSGARLDDVEDPGQAGTYDLAKELHGRYGDGVALALLGPAARMRLFGAGINVTDVEGTPSRLAARGGLGAVMGSKRVLAIVVERGASSRTSRTPELRKMFKDYSRCLSDDPLAGEAFSQVGTSMVVEYMNSMGALPTRNFSEGSFESAEDISSTALLAVFDKYGGTAGHRCMNPCTVRCSNQYPDRQGGILVSPLEYETLGMLGSNIGVGNLDDIARLNFVCNDLGLDTIETGAALGVLMDAGELPFGDVEGALAILRKVPEGDPLARIIASGAQATGNVFGWERVPVAKGQALSAYDPRVIKGTGVTYATSPMGGDHTAGITAFMDLDHDDPSLQAAASAQMQVERAGFDALGICAFTDSALRANKQLLADIVGTLHGETLGEGWFDTVGREVLALERDFNMRAGIGQGADRLPDYFAREQLGSSQRTFDVPDEALDSVYTELLPFERSRVAAV